MAMDQQRLHDVLGDPPHPDSAQVLVSSGSFRGFTAFRGPSIPLDGRSYILYGYTILPCGVRVASNFEIDTKCPTLLPGKGRLWHIKGTWYIPFQPEALSLLGVSPHESRPFSWTTNVPIQTVEKPPYREGQALHSRIPVVPYPPAQRAGQPAASDKTMVTDAYWAFRKLALAASRPGEGAGQPACESPAWGALMERHAHDGLLTLLLCLSDGTTSLYLSRGGAVIGGHGRDSVRQAASRFIAAANKSLASAAPGDTVVVPAPGNATFYLLTDDGVLQTGETPWRELLSGGHPLSPLCLAGQAVSQELLREAMSGVKGQMGGPS